MNSKSDIIAKLNSWSQTDGYFESITDNLFIELSEITMHEYAKADGAELVDKTNGKAKMKAVHSSAALVCNFFEYWRDKDKQPLSKSMGLKPEIKLLSFEQKFSMGMQGKMPNLDIFFLLEDGSPIAIESKFTEWMDKSKSTFADSYFTNGVKRWDKVGLPKCQLLAEHIYSEKHRNGYFNEAQMLKHALGVANKLGNQATLIYLYYDLGKTSEVGKMHKREILKFQEAIDGELNFDAISYQEVFQELENFANNGPHSDYVKYLKNRYFS